MSYGLPYDSDAGRALAGAITAIMTGHAYEQSAEIAGVMGAFKGYRDARCSHVEKPLASSNVDSMLGVIKLHREAVEQIQPSEEFNYLKQDARHCWDAALQRGQKAGYRNAQVTVLAPTAQPFISGAISKTVNIPADSTVADIRDSYVQAWKMGLKCVAIYRDGSKRSQPLNTKRTNEGGEKSASPEPASLETRFQELQAEVEELREQAGQPLRRRLTDTRTAITHKFDIAGHEGYLTVGLFGDGQPGELFITMAKEGSTIGGLMDGIGTLTSMALQYGVPLEALVRKFAHQRFEPSGFTKNAEIRNAFSITDYVFRWLD